MFCSAATSNAGEGSQTLNQLLLPAPGAANGPAPPGRVEPNVDLLSGDFNSPKAETSLALVPLGEQQQQPNPPASDQNALVLFDMFSDSNNASNPANPPPINPGAQPLHPHGSQLQQQQPNVHSPQAGLYPNGNVMNMGSPNYEQSMYMQGVGSAWNGQTSPQQQQQPHSPGYGTFIYTWLAKNSTSLCFPIPGTRKFSVFLLLFCCAHLLVKFHLPFA